MNGKIFGHDWADIQRAQQGGKLHRAIALSKPVDNSLMPGDQELFEKHGIEGLRKMQYLGVIDRLQRNGFK